MSEAEPRFCDVAVPAPLDRLFTYALPETLRRRAAVGSRLLVPFGARKLIGLILRLHSQQPDYACKQAYRLLDEEPALTPELLRLGRWIAEYYCTPLGEVLRGMLPLGGETRSDQRLSLTPAGVEAARQFSAAGGSEDPYLRILDALSRRPLSAAYVKKKIPGAANALKRLAGKGLIAAEALVADRDPLRAAGGRVMVAPADPARAPQKPKRGERWLLERLSANGSPQEMAALVRERRDASAVARRLAEQGAVRLWKEQTPEEVSFPPAPVLHLNEHQARALESVRESIRGRRFETFLLHGITGSGKTEVYLRAIEETLAAGRGAMLLVPEIALTPAVASRFFERFGDQAAILHSAFTGMERSGQWRRVREGKARLVVGTRSGVFAPVAKLGLVVVDEEHDSSYKQDEMPRYNGRDVALVRARDAGATVVLGSATPSLESRFNCEKGKYRLLELPERIERRPLPRVDIIDMRQEFTETGRHSLFSRALEEAIQERLDAREQVILLLNRRGYSTFVACRSCGERIECRNCSVTLTYHRRERRLLCHYCGYAEPVPSQCPKCESEYIYFLGAGSEKVEGELRAALPKARVARLDRDSVRGRKHYETILNGFRAGEYDILTGTQMIAKGHDIPNVTLVGIVSADVGLGMPDFRAAERTFQLLTQVAGRAGRGDRPGRVILQTMCPEHYAVGFAAAQDYAGFYKKELNFRRMMHYPPFTAMASVMVRSKKLEEALELSGRLGRSLQDLPAGVRMLGPAAASMVKLKSDYRYQFLFKSASRKTLAAVMARIRAFAAAEQWPATALVIDVDPLSLM